MDRKRLLWITSFYRSHVQIMATNALQRRLRGTGITVSSLHPGVVSTEITRSSEDMFIIKLLMQIDSKVISKLKDCLV